VLANINHFNHYFSRDLKIEKGDVIGLHEVNDVKEIIAFLLRPHPFCKYCNRKAVKFGIPFGISEKAIEEWT